VRGDAPSAAIIGGGPCGLGAAIALERAGIRATVFDRSCVVSSIASYPIYMTFFSTAEKISIGGLPFVTATDKPTRRDALAYYRLVVQHFGLTVRQYEPVVSIQRDGASYLVRSETVRGAVDTRHDAIVIATGYFGSPNLLGVPGESLPHVTHVYREGHQAFQRDVVVVGGGNSAAESALDLWRCGARVTLVHFQDHFDPNVKPWVLPDVQNRIADGSIPARWNARVAAIEPECVRVTHADGHSESVAAQQVYLMTGFTPSCTLLEQAGVEIDRATGIPRHDPRTMETNIPGLFIAGVLAAGYDANKVFIENGRNHGDLIAARITATPT
jgi:thioredoxin reductase (NADPH)